MRSMPRLFIAAFLALHGTDAAADLFKCVGKDGKTAYQEEPCPTAASEQRLRAPAAGPGGVSAMKEGWSEIVASSMRTGCGRDAFDGGKRGWERGGGDPNKLPEAALKSAVDKHCACLVRRITTSLTHAQFAENPVGHAARFASDAANGGECKLELQMSR